MSCITENTAYITERDYYAIRNMTDVKHLNIIGTDDDYPNRHVLAVYDYNGALQYDFKFNNYIVETNYLDGEENEVESDCLDTQSIADLIKEKKIFKNIDEDDRRKILAYISYSTKE